MSGSTVRLSMAAFNGGLRVVATLSGPAKADRANDDRAGWNDCCAFVIDGATGLGDRQYMGPGSDAAWLAETARVAFEADVRPDFRMAAIVEASWATLDDVVAHAPEQLRKGPRGGGRDRDKIYAHVIAAEAAYARKVGVRHKVPSPTDADAIGRCSPSPRTNEVRSGPS